MISLYGLNDDATTAVTTPPSSNPSGFDIGGASTAWTLLSLAGAGTGAYHGYKRNGGSVGWAFGWSLFGGIMPIFSIPVMLAEGFAKPKKGKTLSGARRRR